MLALEREGAAKISPTTHHRVPPKHPSIRFGRRSQLRPTLPQLPIHTSLPYLFNSYDLACACSRDSLLPDALAACCPSLYIKAVSSDARRNPVAIDSAAVKLPPSDARIELVPEQRPPSLAPLWTGQ